MPSSVSDSCSSNSVPSFGHSLVYGHDLAVDQSQTSCQKATTSTWRSGGCWVSCFCVLQPAWRRLGAQLPPPQPWRPCRRAPNLPPWETLCARKDDHREHHELCGEKQTRHVCALGSFCQERLVPLWVVLRHPPPPWSWLRQHCAGAAGASSSVSDPI